MKTLKEKISEQEYKKYKKEINEAGFKRVGTILFKVENNRVEYLTITSGALSPQY